MGAIIENYPGWLIKKPPIIQGSKTRSLLHFDNNLLDATGFNSPSMTTTAQTSTVAYNQGKFGTCFEVMPNDKVYTLQLLNCYDEEFKNSLSSGNWTIDFWLKFKTDIEGFDTSFIMFIIDGLNTPSVRLILNKPYATAGADSQTITVYTSSSAAQNWSNYTSLFPSMDTWYHLALVQVKGTNTCIFFINGILTATVNNVSYVYHTADTLNSVLFSNIKANNRWAIDELRFSSVARWTSNFTPPIAPYAVD